MDCRHPTEAAGAIGRLARIFVPPPVALDPLAIGVTAPDRLRDGFNQQAIAVLLLAQCVGRLFRLAFRRLQGRDPRLRFGQFRQQGADCSGVDLSRDDTGLRAAKFHRNGVLRRV